MHHRSIGTPTIQYSTKFIGLFVGACTLSVTPAVDADLLPPDAFNLIFEPGDTIPGLDGGGFGWNGGAINDSGQWVLSGATVAGWGVIGSQGVVWNPSWHLTDTSGVSGVGSIIRDVALNNAGQVAWNGEIAGPALPSVFVNGEAVVSAGDPAPLPISGGPFVHSNYFDRIEFNDSGRLLVSSRVLFSALDRNDTAVTFVKGPSGAWEQTLVGAPGVPVSENSVIQNARLSINSFNENVFDMNAAGSVIYNARLSSVDGISEAVMLDQTIIAVEGDEAPLEGYIYDAFLSDGPYSVNDSGDTLFSAFLERIDDGGTFISTLIRNGEIVVNGSDLPFARPQGSAWSSEWAQLDSEGNVFWTSGKMLNDDGTTSVGMWKNDTLLFQTGMTIGEGMTLTSFSLNFLRLSDNGKWLIFSGIADDNGIERPGVFTVAIPGPSAPIALACLGLIAGRRQR